MPNNLTDTEENRLLDLSLEDGDLLALLSAGGTESGAGTEVAGGSYARQAVDWNAAAGGSKTTAAGITFTDLVETDVQGWAIYDSTGATRKWYGVISAKTGTAQNADDTVTVTAHGYADGQKVVFQSGYAPPGLTANTTYYVRDATTSTFKVAAALGGAALAISGDSAAVVVGKVIEVAAGGGVNLSAGAVACSLS